MVLMLRASEGRYSTERGWSPSARRDVPVIDVGDATTTEGYGADESAADRWMSIAEHTGMVVERVTRIAGRIGLDGMLSGTLADAARLHDAGKAHTAFQSKIRPEWLARCPDPPAAKAPKEAWRHWRIPREREPGDERRKHFRHELASALIALHNRKDDLVVYLSGAHHGKVRLSLRSMPGEERPPDPRKRFARGVWDGDVIPRVDLGDGHIVDTATLDLSVMELGSGPHGPSWLERMASLRDSPEMGPFRLALLESIMKAADERASEVIP